MAWIGDKAIATALGKIQFHQIEGSSIQRAEQTFLMMVTLVDMAQEFETQRAQLQVEFNKLCEERNGELICTSQDLRLHDALDRVDL